MCAMVQVNCHYCGKKVFKRNKDYKKNPNGNFYCDQQCYKQFRSESKKVKEPTVVNCDYCEKDFEILLSGSGGNNRKYCYSCFPEGLNKRERQDLRMYLLRSRANREKMSIGCTICGYNKTGYALDWHHVNDDKEYNPSEAMKKSWELYQKEIEKCVLLCSNCHREVHAGVTKL